MKYYCKELKCNNEISSWSYEFSQGICRSCSKKGKLNGKYIDGRFNKKHYCIDCKKEINYQTGLKGCNRCRSCNNKKRYYPKNKLSYSYKDGRSLKIWHCLDCDKIISSYQAKRCAICSHKGKHNPNYLENLIREYPIKFNRQLKEQIRKRDNYICQICDIKQENCYRKLGIHHIDYDKNNLNPENLITLCQSCHTRTNANRNYWQSYFINDKVRT